MITSKQFRDSIMRSKPRRKPMTPAEAQAFAGYQVKPKHRRSNTGKGLEALVLASQGDVVLLKVPNGVQWLPGGKTVPKAGPCDFLGLHLPTKRMVILDAKQCDLVTRFPVGNRDHVKPHQIAELIRFGEAGALSGLLIEATKHRQLYWLPWQMLDVRPLPPSYQWDELYEIGPSAHAVRWDRIIEIAAKLEA